MRAEAKGCVIAIASGKGGVGKTWFAITLAHALARRGQRVLLFDGDLGLANVDIQLGLMPTLDLAAVASRKVDLTDALIRHEAGFDILAGRSGSGTLAGIGPAALRGILDALDQAASRYDYVLLDLGASLEPPVRRMAASADTLLVLVTDEPTSLTDAYAVLKLHAADRPGADARIIVNQALTPTAAERTYATLGRACTTFLGHAPVLAGVIRRDPLIPETIRRQSPLLTRHPTCPAARDVEHVATSLAAPLATALA